jgi:Ca-activated chloride channel homolog
MQTYKKGFLTILLLIGITSAALAYIGSTTSPAGIVKPVIPPNSKGVVAIDTKLVQDKTLKGSEGKVAVALTLTGANLPPENVAEVQPIDLVVVLDRSGSMEGQKLNDARTAVIRLMERLTPRDRLAVITYSDEVQIVSSLVPMNTTNLENLTQTVRRIYAGGSTNLGGGLEPGIAMLLHADGPQRQRKVILISDGLANRGVIAPGALGAMAANGTEHNVAVSTVGVGYDFNEVLMTTIADHGSGNYYFLEDPQSFAKVFEKEFETTRNIVAGNLEIRVPLHDGVQLIHAGGYPITKEGNVAVVHPGELLAGQQRNLFLTYHVPADKEGNFSLGTIDVQYQHNGEQQTISTTEPLTVACVEDQKAVVASIDKKAWSEQVVKEEYNKLKEDVATAIRTGAREEALQTIQEYEDHNRTINSSVGSAAVSQNLDSDVKDLRQNVEGTFSGAPAAVEVQKKQQAKALQYESYKMRRDKK